MRNFEKKLTLKLKEETERIMPNFRQFDIVIKTEAEEKNQHANSDIEKRRLLSRKRMIAAAAAIIFLFISITSLDYFFESKGNGYSFQIIAFAGSGNIDSNNIEERLLEADISMVMPNGQITLNPNVDTQDAGAYGWGTGSFYVTGKNIARVTYSLENGRISHYDTAMEYKQNIEGNPVQIEFFLPYTVLNLDEKQISEYELEEKYTERLKELWNSGESPELEAAKKGYFAGKSLDIEKYSIMNFVGTWKAAQTNGRYFRFRDTTLDEQLNREAQKLTVEYYDFDYGKDFNFDDSIYSVLWSPTFKPNTMIDVTTPEDLPGDKMTITIELQNGEILKKVILLSFDKEGYVVAKIK